jgi:hypothetical protein
LKKSAITNVALLAMIAMMVVGCSSQPGATQKPTQEEMKAFLGENIPPKVAEAEMQAYMKSRNPNAGATLAPGAPAPAAAQ